MLPVERPAERIRRAAQIDFYEVNTRAMAAADFFAMTMRLPEASQSTGSCVSEELLPVLEGSRLPILLASARAHLAVRWPDTPSGALAEGCQ
jgi:hypothetical protein